jgi:hypothetical protein
MDQELLDLMYGSDEQPKAPAKTYQKLSGLKLSGQHQYVVEIDGKIMYLANSTYVHLLEKRIQELNQTVNSLKNYVKKLANSHNQTIDGLGEMAREINTIRNNNPYL